VEVIMSVCERCNETSPNPVSEVTINQTILSFGDGDVVAHEWSESGDGLTNAFQMDYALEKVDVVSIGGVVQSADAYDITGDTITFDDIPAQGETIVVRGLRLA
jgi:hypothetical protein